MSAKPKLYIIPPSPPVRAVLLCAKAIGLELDVQTVDLFSGEQYQELFLKLNPQHTVPTLVDSDGYVLWDSHAIMGYLVAKYGKDDSLYPKDDIKRRSLIDQRLHFESGNIFSNGRQIVFPIIYQGANNVDQKAYAATTLKLSYDILEKFLDNNKYVAGNTLSIADFSLITSIQTFGYLVPITPELHPNINSWIKRIESLPYFREVNDDGLEMFKKVMDSKLASS